MKNRFFVIFSVCLLLTGFTLAQEKPTKTFNVHFKSSKIIESAESDPSALTQATKLEKSRLYVLTCFAAGVDGGQEIIDNCLKLSDFSTIYFWTQVFALLKTKLRFHIWWLGPETVSYTTDWFTWLKNECAFFGVTIDPTEWKKGVYTVVWMVEIKQAGAGVGLKKQCVVRFY